MQQNCPILRRAPAGPARTRAEPTKRQNPSPEFSPMISLRRTAAALVCLALLAAPALAKDKQAKYFADSMDFAMHDAIYTMYHEIGHMLVSELELPVLGKEEDAADSLATIWLLTDDTDDDSWNALIDAADGWYFNAVNSTGSGVAEFSYYDDHSLDIQRAYAMVCMMVGYEPEVFGDTADVYDLSEDRQEACAYTYEQALNSWNKLLQPYVGGSKKSSRVQIIYDDAGEYEEFAEELKSRGLLEHAAGLVSKRYALPNKVTFRATQCGEANAYYSPSEREVTYCYELAEQMFYLYLYDIVGWGGTAN
ncbi:MAG: hypothetical protein EOP20_02585 [Hyphomicrobiales bacterium]|nr:MAG: hypothetical protein EOP20_02585 [Hyphomicrobiales bacterium]